MKLCDPNVRAKCPDGQYCELYATFTVGSWCDQFNKQVLNHPITNADRIRSMSDKELAEFFHKRPICPKPKQCEYDCSICWLEWLKQPAEGE